MRQKLARPAGDRASAGRRDSLEPMRQAPARAGLSVSLSTAFAVMAARRLIPRRNQARAAYPRRRRSNANGLCGWNSAGVQEICTTFQRDNFPDVFEFESYMPSHAVVSTSRLRSWAMPAPQVERLMKAAGRNCHGHQDAARGARVRAVPRHSLGLNASIRPRLSARGLSASSPLSPAGSHPNAPAGFSFFASAGVGRPRENRSILSRGLSVLRFWGRSGHT